MPADLVMPKLGLNMTEGQLASWQVGPGDSVTRGDILFTVETDKIAAEIEAVDDGEIVEIIIPAGETVSVGTPVARWSGGSVPETSLPLEDAGVTDAGTASNPKLERKAKNKPAGARIIATPYARRRAAALGVDLADVEGSGPRGRIKAADVEKAAEKLVEPAITKAAIVEAPVIAAPEPIEEEGHWLETDVDLGPSLALLEKLSPDAESGIDIATIVVAATGCAYDGPVAFIEKGMPKLLPVTHTLRLGEIVGNMEVEARPPIAEDRAGLVTVARSAARIGIAPTASVVFSLGAGRVVETFRPDSNGAPVRRCEMTLTLSARSSAMTLDNADALLSRIKDIIETPSLLLLGRSA